MNKYSKDNLKTTKKEKDLSKQQKKFKVPKRTTNFLKNR